MCFCKLNAGSWDGCQRALTSDGWPPPLITQLLWWRFVWPGAFAQSMQQCKSLSPTRAWLNFVHTVEAGKLLLLNAFAVSVAITLQDWLLAPQQQGEGQTASTFSTNCDCWKLQRSRQGSLRPLRSMICVQKSCQCWVLIRWLSSQSRLNVIHEAWESLASFQSAFALGEKEGKATWNLLMSVDPAVADRLMSLARQLGWQKNPTKVSHFLAEPGYDHLVSPGNTPRSSSSPTNPLHKVFSMQATMEPVGLWLHGTMRCWIPKKVFTWWWTGWNQTSSLWVAVCESLLELPKWNLYLMMLRLTAMIFEIQYDSHWM